MMIMEERNFDEIKEECPKELSSSGTLILWWNGEAFEPTDAKNSKGIFLERNDENKLWLFSYSDGTGLIARRTAMRRANEVAKVGYVHPISKQRTGIEYILKEMTEEDLPDSLKRAQRAWYERKDEKQPDEVN